MSTPETLRNMAALLLAVMCVRAHARALPVPGRRNASCMLVFGDSTVDPGNNNLLPTSFKANFLPYGEDFLGGLPTGRFCDGRLATDFIAETLGISTSIPAFLDPNLTLEQLKHGVSFASGASGYDELTASYSGVISLPKQIEYMRHYKIHLQKLAGPAGAQRIVEDALVVISAGTNDFIQNYYLEANRSAEFTEPQYEDYLIGLMSQYVREIHGMGAKRFVLVNVPPMGCLPVVKTMMGPAEGCYEKFNDVAMSFNSKLAKQLDVLIKQLGLKAASLDIYSVLDQVTKNPTKYGFAEVDKGCCGSGTMEMGETCKGQSTCGEPRKYMYWDAIHPTQYMYKLLADEAMRGIADVVLA